MASVRELTKLRDSDHLKKIMTQIDKYSKLPRKSADIVGPVESDPEYQLIVEANNIAADIDDEISNYNQSVFLSTSQHNKYTRVYRTNKIPIR